MSYPSELSGLNVHVLKRQSNHSQALLDSGAHLDSVDGCGRAFADLLTGTGQQLHQVVRPMQFTTLQCLAARVIKKESIPYKPDVLSPNMEAFVDIH